MISLEENKKALAKKKVGDKVFSILQGQGEITKISPNVPLIYVKFKTGRTESYLADGRSISYDKLSCPQKGILSYLNNSGAWVTADGRLPGSI